MCLLSKQDRDSCWCRGLLYTKASHTGSDLEMKELGAPWSSFHVHGMSYDLTLRLSGLAHYTEYGDIAPTAYILDYHK